MALIKFTPADFLASKVIEAGNYQSQITRIEGPIQSKTGKSIHYFTDIEIIDGPYKGKARTIVFNSVTNSPSVLGEAQFFPQTHLQLLDEAINGTDQTPREYILDTDSLLHKPFTATWGIGVNEGRAFNVINAFHKQGYGSQGGPITGDDIPF